MRTCVQEEDLKWILPLWKVRSSQLRGSWRVDINKTAESGSYVRQIEHQV